MSIDVLQVFGLSVCPLSERPLGHALLVSKRQPRQLASPGGDPDERDSAASFWQ